jgi:predicted nucleic acid-binding protein
MVVIDTNILAYLLIDGDRTREAQALLARDPEWRSDGFLLIEFSNILATYRRNGLIAAGQAQNLLNEAETRMRGWINIPHVTALQVADRHRVSVYDARFLAVAQQFRARLVTEDLRLRSAAPELCQSLQEALA